MPKKTSTLTPNKAMLSYFDERRPRAYRIGDLSSLLEEQREAWKLPASVRTPRLIELLTEEGALREVTLRAEGGQYRDFTRFVWGGCTPLEIASTLKNTGYLTHGTAVFLHGLTEQVPRTIYVNHEQTPKSPPTQPLSQAGIDRAFKGKQRSSRYTFLLDDSRYTILSGKNSGRYGVEEMRGPSGETLRVTNLERTLVDIIVRPAYAGGVYQVLEAYKSALERKVSVSRIIATLRALDYKYPYHQSIGFLMERAGFEVKKLQRLRELGSEFDFYLGYGLKNPVLDHSWRIFHPEGF